MKTQLNNFSVQDAATTYFTDTLFGDEEEKTNAPSGKENEDKAYICDKQCHKCKCLTKTTTL